MFVFKSLNAIIRRLIAVIVLTIVFFVMTQVYAAVQSTVYMDYTKRAYGDWEILAVQQILSIGFYASSITEQVNVQPDVPTFTLVVTIGDNFGEIWVFNNTFEYKFDGVELEADVYVYRKATNTYEHLYHVPFVYTYRYSLSLGSYCNDLRKIKGLYAISDVQLLKYLFTMALSDGIRIEFYPPANKDDKLVLEYSTNGMFETILSQMRQYALRQQEFSRDPDYTPLQYLDDPWEEDTEDTNENAY